MNVEDVMTPHPVTVRVETTVEEALTLLADHRLTSLPVLDRFDRVCGVVSETDLIRRDRAVSTSLVQDIFSPLAVTIGPHDDARDAVALLTSTTVKSLPVIDRRGALIGVLSHSDIVHVLNRVDK